MSRGDRVLVDSFRGCRPTRLPGTVSAAGRGWIAVLLDDGHTLTTTPTGVTPS